MGRVEIEADTGSTTTRYSSHADPLRRTKQLPWIPVVNSTPLTSRPPSRLLLQLVVVILGMVSWNGHVAALDISEYLHFLFTNLFLFLYFLVYNFRFGIMT